MFDAAGKVRPDQAPRLTADIVRLQYQVPGELGRGYKEVYPGYCFVVISVLITIDPGVVSPAGSIKFIVGIATGFFLWLGKALVGEWGKVSPGIYFVPYPVRQVTFGGNVIGPRNKRCWENLR